MAVPERALAAPAQRELPRLGLAAALALGVALAAAWRLPFAGLPITTDEAGYATVARLWAHGERLYRAIWVDRPQGLLLVFRALLHVDGGSAAALRGAAVVSGGLLVLLVAATAHELGGRRRAGIAAVLAGAFGCSPLIESFTLSGELVAAVPSVAAAYCFVRWQRRGGVAWIGAAGLLSGCAVMVKQSAFDVALAAGALLLLSRPPRWRRALMLLAIGALVPVAACAAAAPGVRDWWFAVVAYRFHGDSIVTGSASARLGELVASLRPLAAGLAPLLVLGGRGLAGSTPFVRVWAVAAALGVIGGGQFHAHYYIQLVAPLAVAGASGLERMLASPRRLVEAGVVVVAAAAAVAFVLPAAGASTAAQVRLFFPHDPHLADDAAVARAADALSPSRASILVVPPTASLYYLAHRRPGIPYLWVRNVQTLAAAASAERRALATAGPALVVVEGRLRSLPRIGLTLAEVEHRYRRIAAVGDSVLFGRRRASAVTGSGASA